MKRGSKKYKDIEYLDVKLTKKDLILGIPLYMGVLCAIPIFIGVEYSKLSWLINLGIVSSFVFYILGFTIIAIVRSKEIDRELENEKIE